MQISINWLTQLVNIKKIDISNLSDKLTLAGFEVEDILNLKILDKEDTVFDIASTANRPDTLNMLGFRTEISALLDDLQVNTNINKEIERDKLNYLESGKNISTSVSFEDCKNFIISEIDNIQVNDSPLWLKRRLIGSGIEPLNNIVDISNYVMLEWGQPFRIYDLNKIKTLTNPTFKLSVRNAKDNEDFYTSDNNKYTLTPNNLIVCADDLPISISGIIGSSATAVDSQTTSILVEGSVFNAKKIRQSSRSIGLRTEESSRCEKILNLELLPITYKRIIKLLKVIGSNEKNISSKIDYKIQKFELLSTKIKQISLKHSYINQILGATNNTQSEFLTVNEIEECFSKLKLKYLYTNNNKTDSYWLVNIPSYRINDLFDPIDLIEEVGRIYGFNNFLSTLPEASEIGLISEREKFKRKFRQSLINIGLKEIVQYSLTKFKSDQNQVKIINPLVNDYAVLRTTLLPNLIKAYTANLKRTGSSLQGFEIGRIFKLDKNQTLQEFQYVSGIFNNELYKNNWNSTLQFGWFDAKGLLEEVFEQLNLPVKWKVPTMLENNELLNLNRTSELFLFNEKVGFFSQLHPRICLKNEILSDTFLFEFDLNLLNNIHSNDFIFKPYSEYPTIVKDIAFIVPLDTTFSKINSVIRKDGFILLDSVCLMDDYRGKQVKNGCKSITIRLTFKSSEGTLNNIEIDQLVLKITDQLKQELNVVLR